MTISLVIARALARSNPHCNESQKSNNPKNKQNYLQIQTKKRINNKTMQKKWIATNLLTQILAMTRKNTMTREKNAMMIEIVVLSFSEKNPMNLRIQDNRDIHESMNSRQ